MGPALQAIQRDDAANPAMLWLEQGKALWNAPAGTAAKSCAECHGPGEAMRGVAARYPAFDAKIGAAIDLDRRIDFCRMEYQQAPSPARESQPRLALELFVAFQSRGLPVAASADPRLDPVAAEGEALFRRRQGQINLSCAQCHDERAGEKLAGVTIPQAHPTGYPIYRSEWQGIGSLQRRLRNCMIGTRAEPYAYGSAEYLALETYLMRRANGMRWETPAVRP
ncbi:MAG: sulfur oxidation c-type cytochrome SoxA [Proteobacteria bacterium]|nr:sulfur oxidation c-type cytochrome SoxA [Pseudomonadota bacterium]